jgi:hypothetical protein
MNVWAPAKRHTIKTLLLLRNSSSVLDSYPINNASKCGKWTRFMKQSTLARRLGSHSNLGDIKCDIKHFW